MLDSLRWGGSERQAVEVACRQKAMGYDVTFGCLRAEGPLQQPLRNAGVPIVPFSPPSKGFLTFGGAYEATRLVAFLRRGRYDVVHTHDVYSNLMAVPAAWLARVPVIVSSRRDLGSLSWYTPRNRKILSRVQELSTFVVANSEAVRSYLLKQEGFDPKTVRVVRNGVDLDAFASATDSATNIPPLDPRHKVVIVVANMHSPAKGHLDLIEAARTICEVMPETRFWLVGDGAERGRFEARVAAEGLRDVVLFLGNRNDMPALLARGHLSVLPSWAEGMPNAVIESMASGLPVVASAVGGILEVVEDGKTGLLVPPRCPSELAKAILTILQNPDLAASFGSAGRERTRRLFSFDRVLEELGQLYQEAWIRKVAHRRAPKSFLRSAPSNHAQT